MNSNGLTTKGARVRWADLPPELLAIIYGGLQNPNDAVRFRWVCRSWRIAASPPNKLSPFFPLTLPSPVIGHPNLTINDSAVYLLQHRHNPRKAWMVSVQESVAGKLVLRHALTYDEIAGGPPPGNLFDLSPDDWILTQVARSYSRNSICERCNGIQTVKKVTIVTNSCCGSIQLVGWHKTEDHIWSEKAFFVFELSGEACKIEWDDEDDDFSFQFADFVNFNGWTYTIDAIGNFYLVDHKKSRLLPIAKIGDLCTMKVCTGYNSDDEQPSYWMWLVVSDGDLYVVVTYDCGRFRIYRLVIKDHTDGMITSGKWRKVTNLGERVFFLANNCSFSVSARDLPHPWKGNCIVFSLNDGTVHCSCYPTRYKKGHGSVFFVKGQSPRLRSMPSLQGYSDLFEPPSSWSDYS